MSSSFLLSFVLLCFVCSWGEKGDILKKWCREVFFPVPLAQQQIPFLRRLPSSLKVIIFSIEILGVFCPSSSPPHFF